ncbi:hypothetical protein JMUB6875_27800 [Nocardia sp. JMUB6875]
MHLEICLTAAILAALTATTLAALRPAQTAIRPPARHRRDRYSVEAIRARIDREAHPGPPGGKTMNRYQRSSRVSIRALSTIAANGPLAASVSAECGR